VEAYADAFALEDSGSNHADDRRQLTELYSKDHKNTNGLGDIVLAEYDRMTALQQELEPQSTNATTTHLANNAIVDMSGKQVLLGSFQGRVVVMDFWATWCHPCRVQHPLFETVKNSFKADPRVVFLEIDAGEDRATVAPFLQKQGWSGEAYLDNDLTRTLNIDSIPTTVLLDRGSKVYSELVGFRPETFVGLLTSRIEAALASDEAKPSAPSQVN
jgi:thiol-disulfide isomerase/thioredoxin